MDNYAEQVTGRWACLSIHGHLVATSTDFYELDPRESRLLLLLAAAQDGAPLRDTLVYLPYMSPDVSINNCISVMLFVTLLVLSLKVIQFCLNGTTFKIYYNFISLIRYITPHLYFKLSIISGCIQSCDMQTFS